MARRMPNINERTADPLRVRAVVMALFCLTALIYVRIPVVAGDYDSNGFAHRTMTSGTVQGGVYISQGGYAGGTKTGTAHFNVPGDRIIWSRLYVGIWGGTAGNTGTLDVTFSGNDLNRVNIGGTGDDNPTFGDGTNVYGSGSGAWWISFNVTSLATGGRQNNATATTGGSLDGRMYAIMLIAVYENLTMPIIDYWVNEGSVNLNYGTPLDSTVSSFSGNVNVRDIADATFYPVYLVGTQGEKDYLYFNHDIHDNGGNKLNGNDVATASTGFGFDLLIFNVTTLIRGSDNYAKFWRGDETYLRPVNAVFVCRHKGDAPAVDYVRIRDASGGAGRVVDDPTYPVDAEDTFWCAAYNNTAGYLGDRTAIWASSDPDTATIITPGKSTTLRCNRTTGGTTTITADWDGITNSTLVTVMEPTVDRIEIRDSPADGGNVVEHAAYPIGGNDMYWCGGYNHTAGYLNDLSAVWTSNDTNVATVTGPGTSITLDAVGEGVALISAGYEGKTNSALVTVYIEQPGVDNIIIESRNGTRVGDTTLSIGNTLQLSARAYNVSYGSLGNINVSWGVTGTLDPVPAGPSTEITFEPITPNTTGTITADDGTGHENATGTITVRHPPRPDLIPTSISVSSNLCANMTNKIPVTINNTGKADTGGFAVRLYADKDPAGNDEDMVGEISVDSLKAGESRVVKFDWAPSLPGEFEIKVLLDPYDTVFENDETNNDVTSIVKVVSNGYLGDRPLETYAHGTVRGDMVHTWGDSRYGSVINSGDSYTVLFEMDIPDDATVKLARLYCYWSWSHKGTTGVEPALRVTFDDSVIPANSLYTDRKGWGYYNYPAGTYAYDVTGLVSESGNYTMDIENTAEDGATFCMSGCGLLVVYESMRSPYEIEYWINEGCDMISSKSTSGGLTPAQATSVSRFVPPPVTDINDLHNATLLTVVQSGGWLNNTLSFNDKSWDGIYDGTPYPDMDVDEREISGHLAPSDNFASFSAVGDYVVPGNAFLALYHEIGKPTVEISFPVKDRTVTGIVEISGRAAGIADEKISVEIRIDNSTWMPVNGTVDWHFLWDTTGLSEGDHTISVRANDGEVHSDVVTIEVKVKNGSKGEGTGSKGHGLGYLTYVIPVAIMVIVIVFVVVLLLYGKGKKGKVKTAGNDEHGSVLDTTYLSEEERLQETYASQNLYGDPDRSQEQYQSQSRSSNQSGDRDINQR